jgi:hypothetical protein
VKHEDFRAALEAGDVRLVRKMWSSFFPGMPQPKPEHAETVMHMARTVSETVSLKARAYSHKWLCERNLPSQLPDKLRPAAERMYPRVVEGVGISVNCRNPLLKPAMLEVRKSMEDAVADAYANGDTDPALVSRLMAEARAKTEKKLFGAIGR